MIMRRETGHLLLLDYQVREQEPIVVILENTQKLVGK
jgi:hypothetical protein